MNEGEVNRGSRDHIRWIQQSLDRIHRITVGRGRHDRDTAPQRDP
jgi:hypothetical protein